jgi:hypothetical protein
MDNLKVLAITKSLKHFFEQKKITVAEVRESCFRTIDYIDNYFDDDEKRDQLFMNSKDYHNHNIYKEVKNDKGIRGMVNRHTTHNGIRARLN